MAMERVMQQSLRRMAAQRASLSTPARFSRSIGPATAVLAPSIKHQARWAATQNLNPDQGHEILVQQRLNRPVAPHLSIYKPQITWIGSSLHRITGSVLSGGFYIFGFGYLVAPLLGMHWESHAIAAAVGSLPLIAKMGLKFSLAMPFTYHCINGVRHLVWDTGAQMTKKQVIWTGWTVVAATVLSSAALVAM